MCIIDPAVAYSLFPDKIYEEHTYFKTAVGKDHSKYKIAFPLDSFGLKKSYPFVIYKFHTQYDGVIGANLLKDLKLKFDWQNHELGNNIKTQKFFLQNTRYNEPLPIKLDHLDDNFRNQLTKIIQSHRQGFHLTNQPLNATNKIKHNIRTIDENPVYVRRYRYPEVHKNEVKKQIKDLLDKKIIRPSISPWSFPIVIVPKKTDQSGNEKWRIAIDYRKLNEKTIDDKFPIPNIDELLDQLKNAKYFSALDLASGFHQIELDEQSIEKTAFATDEGHYEFLRMPFGLKNAPSTFQRFMNRVLKPIINKICIVYMDDILIFSETPEKHLADIQTVLQLLEKENLKIQLDKSYFFQTEIVFLGHKISEKGIEPNPEKIEVVKNFPLPKSVKEIKSYLGMIGYYRKFIPNFSKLTKPMTKYLKKDIKLNIHDQEYIDAFQASRNILINYPILQHPDFNRPFVLTTDASQFAIGAILSQGTPPNDLPIAYASRTLNEAEIKYSTIEKELLAVVWATKYFRPYLFGQKFTIYTDHRPLTWLFSLKDASSRLMRWRIKLEEFNFEIRYRKGVNNNADAISRIKFEELNINEDTDDDDNDLDSIIPQISHEDLEITQKELEEITKFCSDDQPNQSSSQTVHSNAENPILEIPYTERSLNTAMNQIIFQKTNSYKVEKLKLHKNSRIRLIVSIDELDDFTKFLKEYIKPKSNYTIYFRHKELEKPFLNFSQNLFKANAFSFKISNILLEDIEIEDDQQEKIKLFHETKTRHRGFQENFESLKRRFYWPKMDKDIQSYINSCEICQTQKYERQPTKLVFKSNPIGEKPFSHLYIDTIVMNRTPCLTLIDSFSRHGQCYILNSKTATEIANKLINYFSNHGIPDKITFDNGTEFKNQIIQDLCETHKITVHYITNYNPTSNALVERFHSTLIEQIRVIDTKNMSLTEKMNIALLSYNNSIHSSTSYTPMQIVKSDLNYNTPIEQTTHEKISQYIQQYRENMKDISEHLKSRKEKQKSKLDQINQNRDQEKQLDETKPAYLAIPKKAKLDPKFKKTNIKILDDVLIRKPDSQRIYHKNKIKQRK